MRVFISYSRKNTRLMLRLIGKLQSIFDTVEFTYDGDIRGGQDWWRWIQDEIERSHVVLFLLSDTSIKSRYCRQEVQMALEWNLVTIPVRIQPKTRIPSFLKKINVIDYNYKKPESIAPLVKSLKHWENKFHYNKRPVKSATASQPEQQIVQGKNLQGNNVVFGNQYQSTPTRNFLNRVKRATMQKKWNEDEVFARADEQQNNLNPLSSILLITSGIAFTIGVLLILTGDMAGATGLILGAIVVFFIRQYLPNK